MYPVTLTALLFVCICSLCRNNLTVIDMVGVEGFGARELLKVGGRLPGAGGSLRFKVPESTLMDCRRRESACARPVCTALGNGGWVPTPRAEGGYQSL